MGERLTEEEIIQLKAWLASSEERDNFEAGLWLSFNDHRVVATIEELQGENAALRDRVGEVRIWGQQIHDALDSKPISFPDEAPARIITLLDERNALRIEAVKLRGVLEKYADPRNYDGTPSAVDFDDGEQAREVLSSTPPFRYAKDQGVGKVLTQDKE